MMTVTGNNCYYPLLILDACDSLSRLIVLVKPLNPIIYEFRSKYG